MNGDTNSTAGLESTDSGDPRNTAERVRLSQAIARVQQATEDLVQKASVLDVAQAQYQESISALREACAARQGLRRG